MNDVFWAAFGGGAAAGAVVATIEFVRHKLGGPKLVVKVSPSYELLPGKTLAERPTELCFEAINCRSIPMHISGLGFECKKEGCKVTWRVKMPPQDGYPYFINSYDSFRHVVRLGPVVESVKEKGITVTDIRCVYFQTTIEKTFRSKVDKETIKFLYDELKRHSLADSQK